MQVRQNGRAFEVVGWRKGSWLGRPPLAGAVPILDLAFRLGKKKFSSDARIELELVDLSGPTGRIPRGSPSPH